MYWNHNVLNDLQAIKKALQPGVTGTTPYFGGTEDNAGAGLFIIKSFAQASRAFFVIYSGKGMFKLRKTPSGKNIRLNTDPEKDRATMANDFPYWKGTAVGFDISTEINENFATLLKTIHNAYRLEIKQRKKQRYKKARFI